MLPFELLSQIVSEGSWANYQFWQWKSIEGLDGNPYSPMKRGKTAGTIRTLTNSDLPTDLILSQTEALSTMLPMLVAANKAVY